MEGGWFSKLGSRLGAADIRLKSLQQLHGSRAASFQNGALAVLKFAAVTRMEAGPFSKWGFRLGAADIRL